MEQTSCQVRMSDALHYVYAVVGSWKVFWTEFRLLMIYSSYLHWSFLYNELLLTASVNYCAVYVKQRQPTFHNEGHPGKAVTSNKIYITSSSMVQELIFQYIFNMISTAHIHHDIGCCMVMVLPSCHFYLLKIINWSSCLLHRLPLDC